jgi:hypothetical protein
MPQMHAIESTDGDNWIRHLLKGFERGMCDHGVVLRGTKVVREVKKKENPALDRVLNYLGQAYYLLTTNWVLTIEAPSKTMLSM